MTAPDLHNVVTAPGHLEGAELAFAGLTPGFFVALSMLAVVAIMVWKGVPRIVAAALDRRIADIRTQIDEASRLREEAEALKAEYEGKAAAAEAEAAAILGHAREEAAAMLSKAEADAADLVQRRGRMAEDKIAASERAAVAEVRTRAVEIAAAAAARIIAERNDAATDRANVDRAIARLN